VVYFEILQGRSWAF